MSDVMHMRPLKYRSIFISDVHLGFHGCQAAYLLDFLQSTHCKHLYLVGDMIDLWEMRQGIRWPETHNAVVRAILDKARGGTEVTYLPGNHDELLRAHLGADFGRVAIRDEVIHETVDGRRFLVLHGDRFDSLIQGSPWLARVGTRAYDWTLRLNAILSRARRHLGLGYWSLSAYLKRRVKQAVTYIGNFERILAFEARSRAADGVICGHIHHAETRDLEGVLYCNCGDWVESCTALVEHHDGRLEILRWAETRPETRPAPVAPAAAPVPVPAAAFAQARIGPASPAPIFTHPSSAPHRTATVAT